MRRWVRAAVVVVLVGVAAVVVLPRSVEWRKLVRRFSRPSTVAQRLASGAAGSRRGRIAGVDGRAVSAHCPRDERIRQVAGPEPRITQQSEVLPGLPIS